MSNTCAPTWSSTLDEMPWVELEGDLAEAFKEFAATADRRIAQKAATRQASVVVLPKVAYVGQALAHDEPDEDIQDVDEDDLRDVLDFKNGAMTMTPAEQETFDALTRERSPRLAKPLPLD